MKAVDQAQRFWNHEYETGRKRLHVVSRDQLRRPQFLGHLCSLEDCHKNVGRFTFGRVYGQDDAANLVAHGAGPVFDSNRPFFRHVPLPSLREVIWRREDQQFGLNAHSVGPNVALPCWRRQLRSDRSQGMAPDTRAFQNRSDLNLSWQPCSHFAFVCSGSGRSQNVSSWKMIVLMSGLFGLIAAAAIGYLLARVGVDDRAGILVAATVTCAVCSMVGYHEEIEEGISAA